MPGATDGTFLHALAGIPIVTTGPGTGDPTPSRRMGRRGRTPHHLQTLRRNGDVLRLRRGNHV